MRPYKSSWGMLGLLFLGIVHVLGAEPATGPTTGAAPQPAGVYVPLPLPVGAVTRLGHTRFTIDNPVGSLSFSPNGKQLVTTSDSKLVRVWDVKTGQTALIIRNDKDPARAVAISASFVGTDLIAVSWDYSVALHDAIGGQIVRSLETVGKRIPFVVGSPDGQRLLTISEETLLWNAADGTQVADLGPSGPIAEGVAQPTAQFSADGKTIVTTTVGGRIRLWDGSTGRPRALPDLPLARDSHASLSSDGKTIAICTASVELFDVETGKQIRTVLATLPGPPSRPPIPPNPGYQAQTTSLTGLSFSPTGPELALVVNDRLSLMKASGEVISTGISTAQAVWSQDGSVLVASTQLLDGHTGQVLYREWGHRMPVVTITASPDGREISTGEAQGWFIRWDSKSGQFIAGPRREISGQLKGLYYSANGDALYQFASTRRLLRIALNGTEPPRQYSLNAPGYPVLNVSAWSDDFKLSAAVTRQNEMRISELDSGKVIKTITPPERTVRFENPTFSPDSKYLAISCANKTIEVWNLDTGNLAQILDEPERKGFNLLHWSPDGRVLLSTDSGGISIFDMGFGVQPGRMTRTDEFCIAISPDGMFFAVGGDAGVEVRDVATGGVVVKIPLPYLRATAMTFVNNSATLAVGLNNGTTLVYDLRRLMRNAHPSTRPTTQQLQQAWNQLRLPAPLADVIYGSAVQLLDHPKELVEMARTALKQEESEVAKWDRLVQQLSSDDSKVKEKAHHELEAGGKAAAPAIIRALRQGPSGETAERLRSLARLLGIDVARITRVPPVPTSQPVGRRAVQLLEWLGDENARQLLLELSGSDAYPYAKGALARLDSRRAATTKPAATQP